MLFRSEKDPQALEACGLFRTGGVPLPEFLNMVNIIQGSQGFDDLAVGFVFLQFLAADGDHNGVDAEAGAKVGGADRPKKERAVASRKILKLSALVWT